MSVKMKITSDTKKKLQKIQSGDVFDSPLVFVTEFLQNSYRAKAKMVTITTDGDEVTFIDNGCGCRSPKNILTLDFSEWETTEEGFGIGFWSFLAVPEIIECNVASKKWTANINTRKLFEKGEPESEVTTIENSFHGFEVTLKSPWFFDNIHDLEMKIREVGELQPYLVVLNGREIPKKDLFLDVSGDFCKEFSNRLFDAKFCIATTPYKSPALYYEKRLVERLYRVEGVGGVIEMKPKALNLKEPDRRSVVNNEKYDLFVKKIIECQKDLYLDFLRTAEPDLVDRYAQIISGVLNVADYEKLVLVDGFEDEYEFSKRQLNQEMKAHDNAMNRLKEFIANKNEEYQNTLFSMAKPAMNDEELRTVSNLLNAVDEEGYQWFSTDESAPATQNEAVIPNEEDIKNTCELVVGGVVFKKVKLDAEEFKQPDEEQEDALLVVPAKKKRRLRGNIKEQIRRFPKKVWLKASELEEFADLKARAEYYGVRVFVAKNILHEKIYQFNGVSHITEIKNGVTQRYIKEDVVLKTKKEEIFISLLQPICEYFKIPANTFLIGKIKIYIETKLDGKVIDRKIKDNSTKIEVEGVCEGGHIIFDRKYLGLKRFNFGDGLGKQEFKALFASCKLIAHELAHLLYGTEDNTENHFRVESQLYDEIVNLYLAL